MVWREKTWLSALSRARVWKLLIWAKKQNFVDRVCWTNTTHGYQFVTKWIGFVHLMTAAGISPAISTSSKRPRCFLCSAMKSSKIWGVLTSNWDELRVIPIQSLPSINTEPWPGHNFVTCSRRWYSQWNEQTLAKLSFFLISYSVSDNPTAWLMD